MRAWIIGKVVGVETNEYRKRDGSTGADKTIYVKQDGSSERFGPDKVTGPLDLEISEGEQVALRVNVSERHGTKASDGSVWGLLNVWVVEKHPHPQELAPGQPEQRLRAAK